MAQILVQSLQPIIVQGEAGRQNQLQAQRAEIFEQEMNKNGTDYRIFGQIRHFKPLYKQEHIKYIKLSGEMVHAGVA